MPYALPADMARQLLYLAGDKVDFDPWKRKLLEGGWMPRGGSGRSAGRGEVVQMPKQRMARPNQFDEAYARMGPQERALVDRAMGREGAEPGPMSLGAVQQSIRPRSADTAQTSFPARAQEMMALRDKMEMARWGRLLNDAERAHLYKPGWTPEERIGHFRPPEGE